MSPRYQSTAFQPASGLVAHDDLLAVVWGTTRLVGFWLPATEYERKGARGAKRFRQREWT